MSKCAGEKCALQKVEIVRKFKFPQIDGVKFIFESYLWDEINKHYEQWYTNDIFRVYHIPKMGGGKSF